MSIKFIKPAGYIGSKFIIVGEAPGKEEVEEGKPFVGKSGKFLRKMLSECGIEDVYDIYITNAVKVRPPGNKTPTNEELISWNGLLQDEIKKAQPWLILALGTCAAKAVLERYDLKISDVRGVPLPYAGAYVVCSFHPAYIIRSPSHLDTFKKDIKLAVDTYKSMTYKLIYK